MKRKACLFLLTFALLFSALPILAFAETPDTAAKREARAEAMHMLADWRAQGEILVFMEDGVTTEEAEALFVELGILQSLEDREICRYHSYDEFSSGPFWFVLLIPEDRILDRLVELNLSEIVSDAFPNYIIFLDDEFLWDLLGDVDLDGELTVYDYMLVKRAVLGTYRPEGKAAILADLDQNGKVDAIDYMLVKRAVLGTYQPDRIDLTEPLINSTWCVNQYASYTDEALYERIDRELAEDGGATTTLTIAFSQIKEEAEGASLLEELGFSGDLTDRTVYPVVRHERCDFLVVVIDLPTEQLREAMFTLRRCEEIFECALGALYDPA